MNLYINAANMNGDVCLCVDNNGNCVNDAWSDTYTINRMCIFRVRSDLDIVAYFDGNDHLAGWLNLIEEM